MKPTIEVLRQRLETEGKLLLKKAVWEQRLCEMLGEDCPTRDMIRARAMAVRAGWTDEKGVLRVFPANQWDRETVEPSMRIVRWRDLGRAT